MQFPKDLLHNLFVTLIGKRKALYFSFYGHQKWFSTCYNEPSENKSVAKTEP